MARAGEVAGLEEELTCPICLGIYSTPVSLSCGHSFCKACIQEASSRRPWPQRPFACPLCGARADPAMELQPNVQLRSISQKFVDAAARRGEKKGEGRREEEEESLGPQGEVILCDFCLQEPQPAVKTCLTCEASFCQAHLSKHSSKSSLKDHVLMEPSNAQVLAERKCTQHGKVLECYCKTDSVCICVLCCVTSSHKNHSIITLEEAFDQGQRALAETLKTVKAEEAALDESIANLLKQEEEVKTKESLRRNRLETLFEAMCLHLDNKKGEVLKVLSHSEEQQLSQIQTQIQNRRDEKDAASCDVQKLEALRDQKDLLLFTKVPNSISLPSDPQLLGWPYACTMLILLSKCLLQGFAAIPDRKHVPVSNKAAVILPTPPIILDELTTDTTLRLFWQFLSDMQSLFKAPPVHEHLTVSVHENSLSSQSTNVVSAPQPSSTHFRKPNFKSTSANLHNSGLPPCAFGFAQTEITGKESPRALTVVRVELDCRRNTLSFYDASVKDGDPAESLRLIETVSIPSNYPVRATFGVSDGSLKLL
ncbi:putative E3 ubiquitin-protein ligase MID2 [Pluvialis apricaria]